jgi:hypothetical protein
MWAFRLKLSRKSACFVHKNSRWETKEIVIEMCEQWNLMKKNLFCDKFVMKFFQFFLIKFFQKSFLINHRKKYLHWIFFPVSHSHAHNDVTTYKLLEWFSMSRMRVVMIKINVDITWSRTANGFIYDMMPWVRPFHQLLKTLEIGLEVYFVSVRSLYLIFFSFSNYELFVQIFQLPNSIIKWRKNLDSEIPFSHSCDTQLIIAAP